MALLAKVNVRCESRKSPPPRLICHLVAQVREIYPHSHQLPSEQAEQSTSVTCEKEELALLFTNCIIWEKGTCISSGQKSRVGPGSVEYGWAGPKGMRAGELTQILAACCIWWASWGSDWKPTRSAMIKLTTHLTPKPRTKGVSQPT